MTTTKSSLSTTTQPNVVVTSVLVTVTPTGYAGTDIVSPTIVTVFATQNSTTVTHDTSISSVTTSTGSTSQPTAVTTGIAHASRSTRTIIGTVVGIILAIIIGSILAFYFIRRKRRGQGIKAATLDVTSDENYHSKPELAGSNVDPNLIRNDVDIVHAKFELEDTSIPISQSPLRLFAEANEEADTSRHVSTLSLQSLTAEKQVLESERFSRPYPEAVSEQSQSQHQNSTTANGSQPSLARADNLESPKYFVDGPKPHPHSRVHPEPNNEIWLGNQRLTSFPHEQPDSLSRLRAEHEALMDRIRLAEQRELERIRLQP